MTDELTCETCNDEPALGVASVPGVPYSAAYGRRCLQANAHPWWVLVANTSLLGGLAETAPWWRYMVECTCVHLGRTMKEFEDAVAEAITNMEREERAQEESK